MSDLVRAEEFEVENFALRDKTVPCTARTARQLTAQIQASVVHVFVLLAEAHERRAWAALGYDSFGAYVEKELGMSRGRAYQLIDKARVVEAIEAAGVEVSDASDITARDVQAVKNDLPALTAAVSNALDTGTAPTEAVKAGVETVRTTVTETRRVDLETGEVTREPEDTSPPVSEAAPEEPSHGTGASSAGETPEPPPAEPPRSPEPPDVRTDEEKAEDEAARLLDKAVTARLRVLRAPRMTLAQVREHGDDACEWDEIYAQLRRDCDQWTQDRRNEIRTLNGRKAR